MSDPVIVALIGLAGSLVGSLLGILTSYKLMMYRLEQLEKAVDKHNNLIDRTYKLEKHEAELYVEIENLQETVRKLERHHEA